MTWLSEVKWAQHDRKSKQVTHNAMVTWMVWMDARVASVQFKGYTPSMQKWKRLMTITFCLHLKEEFQTHDTPLWIQGHWEDRMRRNSSFFLLFLCPFTFTFSFSLILSHNHHRDHIVIILLPFPFLLSFSTHFSSLTYDHHHKRVYRVSHHLFSAHTLSSLSSSPAFFLPSIVIRVWRGQNREATTEGIKAGVELDWRTRHEQRIGPSKSSTRKLSSTN